MHPALSVIVFTTASGAGYGMLAVLGAGHALGALPALPGLVALAIALALVTGGLLSSVAHLRRPERAWRALSQWRSSWLSREGVMALLTFVPAVLLGLFWLTEGDTTILSGAVGLIAAVGSALTVHCTAMIYRSLKPIREWHHPLVVPVYLGLALATGALWMGLVSATLGQESQWPIVLALVATAAAWSIKLGYWRAIDRDRGGSTPETATGLGGIGTVRLLEPPHTQPNYLQTEMGFRIARKHGARLRRLAVTFGLAVPAALLILALPAAGTVLAALLILLATASGMAGVLIERWLFFAEATHTVNLYYGAKAA